MMALAFACVVVCQAANEDSTLHRENTTAITAAEVFGSFTLDPSVDKDFLWVCIGRLFYYVSTSVTVFLYYYLRDILNIDDETAQSELRIKLASLMIAAQVVGAMVSVPAGRSSNILGRKPVIYIGCSIMSLTFLLYIWAPLMPEDVRWHLVLAAGMCYGLGSGIYVSVDYAGLLRKRSLCALALDCLPQGKTTAEAFGLWGVAGFLGCTLGPIVSGLLLAANQVSSHHTNSFVSHYAYHGYVIVMLTVGVFMNVRQTSCWKKGRPRIVQETLQSNMWSSIICSVEIERITMKDVLNSVPALHLDDSDSNRRGRKGLAFVLKHMLCPCLGNNSNRARKISDDFSSESESTGSSRSSSSSDVL
eukprot:g28163.t2